MQVGTKSKTKTKNNRCEVEEKEKKSASVTWKERKKDRFELFYAGGGFQNVMVVIT